METKTVTSEHVDKAIALFKTEADLIADSVFRDNLRSILQAQWNRPAAPAGKRYVRGAWEYLKENGGFSLQDFLALREAIKTRTGVKRPMVVREYVKRIWDAAVRDTLVHYAQVEANK